MTQAAGKAITQRDRVGFVTNVIVGVVSGVIAALATLLGQSLLVPPTPKVATVDISALVSGEISRLQATGMGPTKAEAYAHVWGPLLDQSAQSVAEEYGVVLLVSPSVVAGAPDLTAEIKERLNREVEAFQ